MPINPRLSARIASEKSTMRGEATKKTWNWGMMRAASPTATLKTSDRTRTGALSCTPIRKASDRVRIASWPESSTDAPVPKGKIP